MSELRGILVRDPGAELIVRPTGGDVQAFGRAGDEVRLARPQGQRRLASSPPSVWIRQDDYRGRAPRVVPDVPEPLWAARSITQIEVSEVSEAARWVRPGQTVHDSRGRIIGWLVTHTYRQSEHEAGARAWTESLADRFVNGEMRYDMEVVGPWRWR